MGKKDAHFISIGYIPNTSYVNPNTARQQLEKQFNLERTEIRLYQLIKNLAAKMAPHISSALIDLGVNVDKCILSRSTILVGADRAGNVDSFYGTKNEQKNTQNNLVE